MLSGRIIDREGLFEVVTLALELGEILDREGLHHLGVVPSRAMPAVPDKLERITRLKDVRGDHARMTWPSRGPHSDAKVLPAKFEEGVEVRSFVNEVTRRLEIGGSAECVVRREDQRLIEVEGYRELFAAVYPDVPLEELTFVHAANGISAFIIGSFTFLDSPWDRFVAGDDSALTVQQARGTKAHG